MIPKYNRGKTILGILQNYNFEEVLLQNLLGHQDKHYTKRSDLAYARSIHPVSH